MPDRRSIRAWPRRRHLAVVATAALVTAAAALAPFAGAAPPANDAFASAAELAGASGSLSGSNQGATREPGEPRNLPGAASVWYRWTAPISGRAIFDTCGDVSFDTVLAVYAGESLASLELLAASDDACGPGSVAALMVSAGSVYHVAVDGYEEPGSFTLGWSVTTVEGPPPANDTWARARPISGTQGRLSATNANATSEAGEAPFLQTTSVWFRWRAPRDMPIVFGTCKASFEPLLVVFRGATLQRSVPLTGGLGCGLRAGALLHARAGTVYRVVVAGRLARTGSFELRWGPGPCRVPALRGQTLNRARRTLARAGCTLGAVREAQSPVVPRGVVMAQWPDPGAQRSPLARVRVAVSSGTAKPRR